MSDKELFDLFRKNQYQYQERPSSNTWKRVERKLDSRISRTRVAYRNTLSMVAALAVLVVVMFLLTMTAEKSASADSFSKPKYLEDLTVPEESRNDAKTLVELSNQLRKHPFKPISEGEGGKKLIPNAHHSTD